MAAGRAGSVVVAKLWPVWRASADAGRGRVPLAAAASDLCRTGVRAAVSPEARRPSAVAG